MKIITQTPRLLIQTFTPNDEGAYLALWADELVREHLPKRTEEETRKIFHDIITDDANGAVFSKWAVINKADGDFIGLGLLRYYDSQPDKLEVGYALHVKYWGNGIATELTNALIEYAKNYSEITGIVAVTTLANAPSQKVLEKAGLTKQENIVRDNEELAFFKMTIN